MLPQSPGWCRKLSLKCPFGHSREAEILGLVAMHSQNVPKKQVFVVRSSLYPIRPGFAIFRHQGIAITNHSAFSRCCPSFRDPFVWPSQQPCWEIGMHDTFPTGCLLLIFVVIFQGHQFDSFTLGIAQVPGLILAQHTESINCIVHLSASARLFSYSRSLVNTEVCVIYLFVE